MQIIGFEDRLEIEEIDNICRDYLPKSILPSLTVELDTDGETIQFLLGMKANGAMILHKAGFRILLADNRDRDDRILTLIHELTHVLQFYSGKLRTEDRYYIWHGVKYSSDTPYSERPWETEAKNASLDYALRGIA